MNQAMIAEMKHEAANTRKVLERVPVDQFGWKPHDKSMSLGRLATHIAELSSWPAMIIETDELNFAAREYKANVAESTEALLNLFDENVAKALATLETVSDETLMKQWTLRNGDHIILQQPKVVVIRSMCSNHVYHHRGQLTVYLRLLDIHVPGIYGPSADDRAIMAAATAAN